MAWFARKKPVTTRHTVNKPQARMYEAAQSNLVKDLFGGGDIDQTIESQFNVIVRRVREAYANNDYIKSYISQACTNVIGHQGIRLQSKTSRARLNSKIEAAFKKWSKRGICDVTGQLSFIDVQLMALRSLLRDGEFFLLKHVIDGRLQLQLLDPTRIDVTKKVNLMNGSKVMNGIELNRFGKPLAYYLIEDDNTSTRIDAKQVIHGFIQEHVGQKRGISAIATSLLRLGLLKEFETAAVDNARSNAKSFGFFRKPENEIDYSAMANRDGETGNQFGINSIGGGDSTAGFYEIKGGYELQSYDSQFPNSNFAPFKESVLKAIGGSLGYGINYINLGNDLKGVSYSSARQGLLSERDSWRMIQTLMMDSFMQPIFDAWLEVERLAGRFGEMSQTTYDLIIDKVYFQCREWDWIDPLKDAKAITELLNNGTLTISQALIKVGIDPDEHFSQLKHDVSKLDEMGLLSFFYEVINQKDKQSNISNEVENAELLKEE